MASSTPPAPTQHSNRWSGGLVFLLLGVIGITFLAIILIQHQIRHLETHFAQTLEQETVLKEEGGKLTLELHHLTALARVEKIAKDRLHLVLPNSSEMESEQTIYLAPLSPGLSDHRASVPIEQNKLEDRGEFNQATTIKGREP